MRAYYRDKHRSRICIVCDEINKPVAAKCKKCGISFHRSYTQESLIQRHNDMFKDAAVEEVLLGGKQ